MLHFLHPHITRQHTSAQYPFNCDFYDPDTGTYFEFNGSWTHGGHWFDPSSADDQQKLSKWKSKGTKYYMNAIETWTIRDARKRLAAEESHLKYVVFWSIDEARSYVLQHAAAVGK